MYSKGIKRKGLHSEQRKSRVRKRKKKKEVVVRKSKNEEEEDEEKEEEEEKKKGEKDVFKRDENVGEVGFLV